MLCYVHYDNSKTLPCFILKALEILCPDTPTQRSWRRLELEAESCKADSIDAKYHLHLPTLTSRKN